MTSQFDSIDGLLVQIRTAYIHIDIRGAEPQLGQYYMAEYAHHKGYNVKVKSFSSNDPIIRSLSDIIHNYSCKIIGFYVDSENIWAVSRITMILKESHPDLFIVIGGPQVTGDPILAMKRIPYAECGIIGEGERPFSELMLLIKKEGKDIDNINGLIYRRVNGDLVLTSKQLPIENLDLYPFPRRYDYTLDENPRFDQISTGRGCVGRCAFCYEGNKTSNHLRLRSISNVIDEIDYIISNLKTKNYISFLDDTFILSAERTQAICNHLIKKYNGSIGWFCEGRVDILSKNLKLLPLLKKAGNIRIQLGGESGCQSILNAYNKHMLLDDLERVVLSIYENQIPSTYINFIIGGAFETIDTFNQTIEFAKHLLNIAPGCAEVGCSLLTPYVGTPIRQSPSNYGIEIIDNDVVTGPDGYIPVVRTKELTREKISQLKSIFDAEIKKEYKRLLKGLSNEKILKLYELKEQFGMVTEWYVCANEMESYKNYFEPQVYYNFASFKSLHGKAELKMAVPYRTVQPLSDGQKFYVLVDGEQLRVLQGLHEDVFLLCSGKLSYFEILSILQKKYGPSDDIKLTLDDILLQFDSERLIIWKWLF
jgi:radical SAM superfamily enzyme YgiQ (UPF0313 family)